MPDLARHYRVKSTPDIVINGERRLRGRIGEEQLLEAVQDGASKHLV